MLSATFMLDLCGPRGNAGDGCLTIVSLIAPVNSRRLDAVRPVLDAEPHAAFDLCRLFA